MTVLVENLQTLEGVNWRRSVRIYIPAIGTVYAAAGALSTVSLTFVPDDTGLIVTTDLPPGRAQARIDGRSYDFEIPSTTTGNAVQMVVLDGATTLTFDGQTTGSIAADAAAATVQTALEALSNLAPGDVTVTGNAGGPYTVAFAGALTGTDIPQMNGSTATVGTKLGVLLGLATEFPAPVVLEAQEYAMAAAAAAESLETLTDVFGGLAAVNDDILQYKSGVWTNRTLAQVLSDLALADTYPTVVLYSGSWPGSRPDGVTVIAVGGTAAPSWLTSADLWFHDETDPLGVGVITNYLPGTSTQSVVWGAANDARYVRVLAGGSITKIGFHVATSSGNISVAVKADSSGSPGATVLSSGAVSCPAAGYQEVSLGGTATVSPGDWLCMSCDNTTATFVGFSGQDDTTLAASISGRGSTSHPVPSGAVSPTWTFFRVPALKGVP